ncbi:hypothetical protein FQN49_007917 [Arthroderma sp. PD_2]|nr:hypothetical protein FQN49_007917 [Arthroderma sp. PD_2]
MGQTVQPEEIEQILRPCVQQRQTHYESVSAFNISFYHDDSGANLDTYSFKDFVSAFGVDEVDECVVWHDDPRPASAVHHALFNHIVRMFSKHPSTSNSRSLVLIHYAGRGGYDPNHGLYFCASERQGQPLLYFSVLTRCISTFYEGGEPFDVVFVIDSCFVGSPPLCTITQGQTIEVLAAVCEKDVALSRDIEAVDTSQTLTRKLADTANYLRKTACGSIDFAQLLQLSQEKPPMTKHVHRFLAGEIPIRLPFSMDEGWAEPLPSTELPSLIIGEYMVVASCHISKNANLVEVNKLISWIMDLPHSTGVRLERIFQSQTIGLVLRMPYNIFCALETLPGVTAIFEDIFRCEPVSTFALPIRPPSDSDQEDNLKEHAVGSDCSGRSNCCCGRGGDYKIV